MVEGVRRDQLWRRNKRLPLWMLS